MSVERGLLQQMYVMCQVIQIEKGYYKTARKYEFFFADSGWCFGQKQWWRRACILTGSIWWLLAIRCIVLYFCVVRLEKLPEWFVAFGFLVFVCSENTIILRYRSATDETNLPAGARSRHYGKQQTYSPKNRDVVRQYATHNSIPNVLIYGWILFQL